MVLKGLLSFRVLIALATSASVTAAVAGPMAYQAAKARDEVVVVAAPTTLPPVTTTTTTEAPADPAPTTSSTTTTTSTTSTTTTTIAGQPAPTTTSTTTTTAPPVTAAGLFSSVYSDHREPKSLDRSRAGVRVWIFYDGPGVTSVSYWVDDPTGSGEPTRVAAGPFDLDPAGTDWRLQYGLGTHTVLAEITTIDGTFRRLATFEVFR